MHYRIIILYILLLSSGSAQLHAQVHMDVHFGVLTNTLEGDKTTAVYGIYYEPMRSFQAGVSLDFQIKDDVFISFQPGYKGLSAHAYNENENYEMELEDPEIGEDAEQWILSSDLSMHNIILPVFLKIISDNDRFQFLAGIETSIPLIAKEKSFESGEAVDIKANLNNINIMAIIGIGYRFQLFKNNFTFDLLYGQSLGNMSSETSLDPSFPSRIKLASAETRLSWKLPIKKK